MRRIFKTTTIIIMVVFIFVFFVSGCAQTENIATSSTESVSKNAYDIFLQKVNGFWGYVNSAGGFDILSFENEKFNDYTYQGHTWVRDGGVEKIEYLSNNEVKVIISYKEPVYGEGEASELTKIEYIFKSDDDFRRNMIMRNGDEEYSYMYLCSTQQELDNYIEDYEHGRYEKEYDSKQNYTDTNNPNENNRKITYTHAALEGAVIVKSDSDTGEVIYKNKCESCSNVDASIIHIYVKNSTMTTSHYCNRCKRNQKVSIQGTMNIE